MQDAKALLDQFLGQSQGAGGQQSQKSSGLNLQGLISGPGGLATGALAGGLAGLLLGGKKPRKLAKSALKVGGVALVGGLAYKAWRDWQANKAPASAPAATHTVPSIPAPEGTPFMPATQAEEQSLSRSLIRAMIAAAKADGHVSDADRAFVEEELSKPLDVDAVARGASCPEQAAEIYAASLLVIDPNGAAERGYLAMLAARLELDPELLRHLHANAEAVVERGEVA